MTDTVVIGGGIAGLASAALLAAAGHTVTLLEKNAELGGRAGLHTEDGFTFDTGPSWYLMPEVFDHLFALLGGPNPLTLVDLDPAYRIFTAPGSRSGTGHASEPGSAAPAAPVDVPAAPVDVPAGRERVLELFDRLEPGSRAAVAAYLDSASRTYRLALDHFLYTTFSTPAGFAHPEVLAGLGELTGLLSTSMQDRIERTVSDPLARQILGYPAVFLGTRPETAPAMYHLMSHLDLVDGVRYPLGGMHTLITALAERARALGVTIRTEAEAVSLTHHRPGRRVGGRLPGRRAQLGEVLARTRHGLEVFCAEAVVAACDLHHLETRLLPRALQTRPAASWKRADPGMGALVLLLGVEGRLDGLAHHNLLFTADWEQNFDAIYRDRQIPNPASVYVCAPSRTDPRVAPAGCENLFVLVPWPADASLQAHDPAVQAYADRIIEQIAHWTGHPDLAARLRVRRVLAPADFARDFHAWSGTALGPANTLSQSIFLRGRVRSKKVGNLFYAGAFTAPGVGLPMCVISAENVLKAFRGDRSSGPLPVPEAVAAPAAEAVVR
ncbi:phytoene desaturase family protein [Brevibacterium otitidis]|uniref:Phytoene desaturase family protein n=1 Tax=Brevibacterium otitidis TaxID=53364 RepID=A0ABV5WZY5_9MICO|nr:phytoene desaturase [Brevibacterium otitidis]